MEGTSRVQLERNIFKDNGWGMKVQASCMDNEISYNNFLANTFDISTNGSLVLNHFNNNYWDKYEGYDLKALTTAGVLAPDKIVPVLGIVEGKPLKPLSKPKKSVLLPLYEVAV